MTSSFTRWAVLGAAAPAPALACGICFEHMLKIRHPAAPALVPVVFLWFLVASVLHFAARLETPRALQIIAAVVTLLACVVAVGQTMGAFTPAALVAGGCLAAYTVAKLIILSRGGVTRPLLVHAGGHLACLGLAAYVFLTAGSSADPERLVSLLNYSIPETGGVAVPRVLALGPAAAEPLVDAATRGSSTHADLRYIAFCLERLCDPRAEAALQRLAAAVPADDERLEAWEPLTFAWAGCAKGRAVEPLVALAASHSTGRRAEILTEALVRTGTPQGVTAALERHAVLLAAVSHEPVSEKAAATLGALATAPTLEALRTLPMYRMDRRTLHLPGSAEGFELEFYGNDAEPPMKAKDVPASWKDPVVLGARWSTR